MSEQTVLNKLKKAFPDCWFKPGNEFNGGNCAAWSGEGSTINDVPAFNYNSWEFDPTEQTWTMGIHNDLFRFVEKLGYYWEANDPCTYLLYNS